MPLDMQNGQDTEMSTIGQLKSLNLRHYEIRFWFQQVKHRVRILVIKSQKWKAIALAQKLLKDVAIALHDYIAAENSPTVYKDLKELILKRFAPNRLDEWREARYA